MPDYVVAYRLTRRFTDEDVAHNPAAKAVMDIFRRQVEAALATVTKCEFVRLHATDIECWLNPDAAARIDGSGSGS